jgi:NAD+ diphosphatase
MTAPSRFIPAPLAGSDLDRAGWRRRDEAWLDEAFSNERAMIMAMRDGEALLASGRETEILWLGPEIARLVGSRPRLFLGLTPKGSPVFAIDTPSTFSLASTPLAGLGDFRDFRSSAGQLSRRDANAFATARAVLDWRVNARYCGRCGQQNTIVDGGWRAACEGCRRETYPRVDPVAIMLAVRGDRCLLGRQAGWRPGLWSCLAGFVEPGETVEEAACRELLEEAGVRASPEHASYALSQPWPFASSLMMGLILAADSEEIRVDPSEIEDARWFSRDEAASMLEGRHRDLVAPPPMAIAHHVIRRWVDGGTD